MRADRLGCIPSGICLRVSSLASFSTHLGDGVVSPGTAAGSLSIVMERGGIFEDGPPVLWGTLSACVGVVSGTCLSALLPSLASSS